MEDDAKAGTGSALSRGSVRATAPHHPTQPLGLMAWIAGYKLLKALAAVFLASVSLRLVNRNLTLLALDWIQRLDINSQGRFAERLLAHVARINTHRLHMIAAVLFFYAVLYATEGIGLFREKRWAEWLTVVQTGLLLPWELWEIARHATAVRLLLFLANVAVVLYLIWRIRRDDRIAANASAKDIQPSH